MERQKIFSFAKEGFSTYAKNYLDWDFPNLHPYMGETEALAQVKTVVL